MTETWSGYSNLALGSTMVVLALALLLYCVDLAKVASSDELPERRPAAGMASSLTWLATLLATATVVLRTLAVGRAPLGNMYEFSLVAAACTLLAFSLWSLRTDLRWMGAWITGLALMMLVLAVIVFVPPADLMPSLKDLWLVIHVTVATIAVALFSLGVILVILHLVRARKESTLTQTPGGTPAASSVPAKEAAYGPRARGILKALPSARRLEQLAYAVHVIAFPLWTFTVIAGAIWAQKAWGSYWNWDPKEVWSFVIWVFYAAYLHARATAGWGRRWAPWLAIAGYICIILNYVVVNYLFVGMHSYAG